MMTEEELALSQHLANNENICRLCLSKCDKFNFLFRLEELESLAVTLSMKVTYCTSVKICKNDLLPRKICKKCVSKINDWYAFKKKCMKSDLILKKIIKLQEDEKLQKDETPANEEIKYFDICFEDIKCDIPGNLDSITTDNTVGLGSMKCDITPLDSITTDIEPSTTVGLNNTEVEPPREMNADTSFQDIDEAVVINTPLLRKRKPKFKCKSCPDSFSLSLDLKNHIKRIHEFKKNVNKMYKKIVLGPKIKYQMKCNICDKFFHNKIVFRGHYLKKHPGEKPFLCEICGKKDFISEETLKRHKMLHSGKYRCDQCGKTFTCNAILKIHTRDKHENDKPYVCDLCGKRFVTELLMNYHKRFHSGEKNYVCEECGLAVVTSSSLAKHRRTHSEVKPFVCQVCSRGFVTNSRLVEHFRVHTGERPFVCEICKKSFTIRDKLKRHSKIHNGDKSYTCEFCGNGYTTSDGLQIHIKFQCQN